MLFLYVNIPLYVFDLPLNCPAGQVMSQCGNACQVTCDTFLWGPLMCPAVCGPFACVCPRGLVLRGLFLSLCVFELF